MTCRIVSPSRAIAGVALIVVLSACRDSTTDPEGPGAIAATQSEVDVASSSVAAGSEVVLTLTSKDAQARPISTGGHAVVFTHLGGSSTGSISATTDHGDGTYTATFAGMIAGTPTAIAATINGVAVTRPLPTVRVRPGPFSPANSYVTVSPRTILADGIARIELHARDAFNNDLDAGGLSVRLVVSGGTGTGQLGTVVDNGDGTYTAVFTGATPGTPLEVSAEVDGALLTSQPPTVTVARGVSAERSMLNVSNDTIVVNSGAQLTFAVRDSANVPRTSGGERVEFLVVGSGIVGTVVDHDNGTYDATLTASDTGSIEISTRLNGNAGPSRTITVVAAPFAADLSTVTVSTTELAAGDSATFTAEVRDVNGALMTAPLSVQFTLGSDGSSGGSVSDVTNDSPGIYTATFVAERAGSPVTIGATVDGATPIEMLDTLEVSHLPRLGVRPGTGSVDSSLVTVGQALISVGDSTLLQLISRDRYGNANGSGGRTVAFLRSAGALASSGRISAVSDLGDGRYEAWYVGEKAGAPDPIRATLDGVALTSPPPAITVSARCPNGVVSLSESSVTVNDLSAEPKPLKALILASGITTTVTLDVRDAKSCSITRPLPVTFLLSAGSSAGDLGPVVDLRDGRYTAKFTATAAGEAASIVATVDGETITSPPVMITVTPGEFSVQTSGVSASRTTVAVGDSVQLRVHSRDAAGNTITQGGRNVTFVFDQGSGGGTIGPTADLGNGIYEAWFTATVAGTTATVVARVDGTIVMQKVTIAVSP